MTLEEKLGYYFFDKRILTRALTTAAYAIEQQDTQRSEDQQAYSVLGRAVLSTVLTELLIRSGYSTQAEIAIQKSQLEHEEILAKFSQEIGAGYLVKLSLEEKQHQAYNDSALLTETLLAILGGIYFDGGFSAARETIRRLFHEALPVQ